MARMNKTKYTLLGALSYGPMTGYDIRKWILRIIKNFWSESDGQIYPALATLIKDHLVTCKEETNGKRLKKINCITSKGTKALQQWLGIPVEPCRHRNELLLKLFFGKNMPLPQCAEHIQHHLQFSQDALCKLKIVAKHIQEDHAHDADSFYWLMVVKHATLHTKTEIVWCKDMLKRLKQPHQKIHQ